MSAYRFYLFPFTSKVGPYDNMAPPSRAKGGAMAPVPPPPPCGRQWVFMLFPSHVSNYHINVVIGWLLTSKCLFLVPVQRPKSVQTLNPVHLNMCCECVDKLKQ